jgi:chemotaxis response regulator CheB
MPGAVVSAGLAHRVLPLSQVAADMVGVAGRARASALAGVRR